MFKLQDIKQILVPQYKELTADEMYSKVKDILITLQITFLIIMKAISHQGNIFVWYLLNSKSRVSRKFIDHSIKERNKQKVTQESKIEISEEIMNQINKKHFYSRQKGRALSMLVESRELYKVNRKRKREYVPYEASKEETKEYQKKRSESMNYESSYNREEN